MMFRRELTMDFFIDPIKQIPYSLYSFDDIQYNQNIMKEINFDDYDFLQMLAFNNKILNDILSQNTFIRHDISHIPKIYNKNFDSRIEEIFKKYHIPIHDINIFDMTCRSKFRKNYNLCFVSILKEYLYVYLYKTKFKKVSHLYFDSYRNNFFKMDNETMDFVCVNDINDQDKFVYHNFMNELYPEKCEFEL